jgi:hypothetical protein
VLAWSRGAGACPEDARHGRTRELAAMGEKKGRCGKLLQGSPTMDSEGRATEGVHGRGLGFPALEESLHVSREGGHARRGEGEAGARVQGAEEQGGARLPWEGASRAAARRQSEVEEGAPAPSCAMARPSWEMQRARGRRSRGAAFETCAKGRKAGKSGRHGWRKLPARCCRE